AHSPAPASSRLAGRQARKSRARAGKVVVMAGSWAPRLSGWDENTLLTASFNHVQCMSAQKVSAMVR
ncbi:MAG TPA: hypothetical protein VFF98_07445, partial [Novosphingobium sp.]|nr:hypothetical protein [Novosphingobium sp.]